VESGCGMISSADACRPRLPRSDHKSSLMNIVVPDTVAWREFVWEHPKGCIFHTPEMVDVCSATENYRPVVLSASDSHGKILALIVSSRIQTLRFPLGWISSRAVSWAEPLCAPTAEGQEALHQLLKRYDRRVRNGVLYSEVRMFDAAGPEGEVMNRAGYAYEDHLNYLVDISRDPEAMLTTIKRQAKQNIKKAQRAGAEVVEVDETAVESVYALIQETYQHASVPVADISLFRSLFRVLGPAGMLKCFEVVYQGRPVAVSLYLLYKNRMYHWYQGSKRLESIYPSELGIWRAMCWGHEHGYTVYDFGGAGRPNETYGPRVFKGKFGGELVNLGRYRKVYAPWKLALATSAYESVRRVKFGTGREEGKRA
jgi:serine/alanine adding enzyme